MNKQLRYALRRGMSVAGVSAEVVGSELTRIAVVHDGITPTAVVQEARPQDAPLHPIFEWDDRMAGELYREHQARHLIRSVEVIYPPDDDGEEVRCAAFVHVPDVETPAYRQTAAVVQHPDQFALALGALQNHVAAAQQGILSLLTAAEHFAASKHRLKALRKAQEALRVAAQAAQEAADKADV